MEGFKNLSRSVKDRVTLITGAGSGMGKATALVFASEGAKVIATDINEENVKKVAEEIKSSGGECVGIALDVTDKANINNALEVAIKEFGHLDHLINNAGISLPTTIEDDDYDDHWKTTLDVVLTGQVNLIRASLPYLLRSDAARIVNISSTEGFGATPFVSPYTAAKHGVIGLTRSLALELGPQGINVNCICPGPILSLIHI